MFLRDRLKKVALSPMYNLVTDDEVQRQLRIHGYKELLDYKKYERVLRNGGYRGVQGGYGFQMAGVGVEHPMIYFAEVHVFVDKKTQETKSAIISFQVNEEKKEIMKNTGDVQIVDGNEFVSSNLIDDGKTITRDDKNTIVFRANTFDEAKERAQQAVDEYKKNIILEDDDNDDKNETT